MHKKILYWLQNVLGLLVSLFLVFIIILLVTGKTYDVFPSLKKFDKKPKRELFIKESDSRIIYVSIENDTSIYIKANLNYDTIPE